MLFLLLLLVRNTRWGILRTAFDFQQVFFFASVFALLLFFFFRCSSSSKCFCPWWNKCQAKCPTNFELFSVTSHTACYLKQFTQRASAITVCWLLTWYRGKYKLKKLFFFYIVTSLPEFVDKLQMISIVNNKRIDNYSWVSRICTKN